MKLQHYLQKCLFILVFSFSSLISQVVCDLSVNLDNIPSSEREILTNFAYDIKTYIESNKWVTDDLGEDKIECSIQIFFTSASENNYTAQLFIGSYRPIFNKTTKTSKRSALIRLFDDKWEFTYVKGQSLIKNETRFDPLTSFIDFYIYLIIGFDFDSYKQLSGNIYFEKAHSIASLASKNSKGWERLTSVYNRTTFVEEILNPDYQNFRKAFYLYHRRGLDWFGNKKLDGQKNLLAVYDEAKKIKSEVNPRSQFIKAFFDTKYLEVVESLKDYDDKNVIQLLSSVDQTHRLHYEQISKK